MTATPPVTLVTGASSGIGKAAALAPDAGFWVIGTSRNSSRVTPGNGVTFLDLDVTSGESVVNVVQQVIERRRRQGDRRGCHRPETDAALPAGSTAGRVAALRRIVPARAFDKSIRKRNRMTG